MNLGSVTRILKAVREYGRASESENMVNNLGISDRYFMIHVYMCVFVHCRCSYVEGRSAK